MSVFQEPMVARSPIGPRARRWAAAWIVFRAVAASAPIPSTSRRRAGSAESASEKLPKVSISRFATGFTSRRGMARNRTSSSSS